MPEPPITTTATVTKIITPGRLFQVELKNGLLIPAHVSRQARLAGLHCEFAEGDRVALEFTPYDFSKARIASGASD